MLKGFVEWFTETKLMRPPSKAIERTREAEIRVGHLARERTTEPKRS